MSNLSDIGFPVKSEEDVNQILMDVLSDIEQMACQPFGFYYRFRDPSGAQLFLQSNPEQELVGFNPAFDGSVSQTLSLIRMLERDTSELDGGYVARSVSGGAAFVFDVPDFRRVSPGEMPFEAEVELTAFASNDLSVVSGSGLPEGEFVRPLRDTEDALFEDDAENPPPQAHVSIAGTINTAEKRANAQSGSEFWVLSVDAGEIALSIVADPAHLTEKPETGDSISGSFWLSGKLPG